VTHQSDRGRSGQRLGGDSGRPRVLVVAEEATLRGLLARLLSDSGFVVQAVADGRTALGACTRSDFALTMVDLDLRGGSELVTVLGKRHPDTAVVVISGVADVATAMECIRAGAYDYLTKPLELGDILARVSRALERHGQALARRRQHQDLQAGVLRETRAARRLFVVAVKSLCTALEAKDDYTRGHSERVSMLSGKLARAIGIARPEAQRIRLAGRLHDIGKIGVRESILAKPGALTEEEYRHIQAHPVIGERILAQGLVDTDTLRIVRHHHEHYGGGGYPDGLRGSDIPLGARVLAVADAFDALTSDRPYRSRLEVAAALGVLRNGAGSQWQPTLVEAVAQHVASGRP
jgi:putative two-component system response regulator